MTAPTWAPVSVGLTWADRPEPCPLSLGARLARYPARAGLEPIRNLRLPFCPGARVEKVARPTLALRWLGSRLCIARVGPGVPNDRLELRLQRLLRLCSTRCDRCDARVQVASTACKRSFVSMRCLQARRGRGRYVPLRALALAGLTSSSNTDRHTATKKALRDGLSSLLLLFGGTAAPVPPSA